MSSAVNVDGSKPAPFRTLGRSGLIVSPLALGTMTFGNANWGSPDDVSRAIFDAYVDAGGNFIDTADVYADGRSEELVGGYIVGRGLRDELVLATKFAFHSGAPGNVNGGGNGRKNIYRALEKSLRRLRTDYIDLYWLHVWDRVTPVEEVVQTLGDLVRAGKIRYFGLSDVPAWYAVKAATLAALHAIPGPIALQLEFSLVERSIEREHIPAADECGLGICAWSPLAFGFLAGKYQRGNDGIEGPGRLAVLKANPVFNRFSDRHWRILETLQAVASESGRSPAAVALAWAAAQLGLTALILGASSVSQLQDNLASAQLRLTADQLAVLDTSSALEAVHPYSIFYSERHRDSVFDGLAVEAGR